MVTLANQNNTFYHEYERMQSTLNYFALYQKIIDAAKSSPCPTKGEWHHIVPRSMGGNNSPENLIKLTYKAHFIAHRILVKIFPENRSMIHAANMMASIHNSSKSYSFLRHKISEIMKNNRRGAGRKVSDIDKLKTSERSKGNKYCLGRVLSDITKMKISQSRIGMKFSFETCKKLSLAAQGRQTCLGVPKTDEQKQKISNSLKNKIQSFETRQKRSKSLVGKRKGVKTGPRSEEVRKRISEKMKGRPKSELTKLKMSLAQCGNKKALGLVRGPMSETHKMKMVESKKRNKELKCQKLKIPANEKS